MGWMPRPSACLLMLGLACPVLAQPVAVGADLQSALDEAEAGAVLELPAGVHRGPIVIERSLTLRGQPGSVIEGTGQGSVITIEADDVTIESLAVRDSGRRRRDDDAGVLVLADRATLRHLSLSRNLHGIYVRGGKGVRIERNRVQGLAATEDEPELADGGAAHEPRGGAHHAPPGGRSLIGNGIHLWQATDARVVGNHVHDVRDGIYVSFTEQALFEDNLIHDCRYGIHYMFSSHNTLRGNDLSRNVAGAALMFSQQLVVERNHFHTHRGWRAFGLLLQDVDRSTFRENRHEGNRLGLSLQNSHGNTFQANALQRNYGGIHVMTSSPGNRFTANRIGPNVRNLELSGRPPRNHWSIDGRGNYWSGAAPVDLSGDGVGSFAHHEVDLLAERREAFEPVQLLADSPGVRLLEWAISRAPLPGTHYITDEHPLTRPNR